MDELIESFISETVINSASVPVLLIDSSATRVVKSQGIDVSALDTPEKLQERYVEMSQDNPPIPVYLPGEGWHVVFYEESMVLTQVAVFPGGATVADRRVFACGVPRVQFVEAGRAKQGVGSAWPRRRPTSWHAAQFVDGLSWSAGFQRRGGGGA